MLVQRLSTVYDIGPTSIQRLVSAGLPIHMKWPITAQQNKHSPDVALMLGELRRRCSNIKPAKNNLFVVKTQA